MSDISSAKQAAKRLYKKYNFQGGPLSSYEISSLLKEVYEYLGIPFNPTQNDIKGYEKVLDADRDGKVTIQDLQTVAIQYLCGDPLKISNKSGSYQSGGNYNFQVNNIKSETSAYQNYQPYRQSTNQGYNYQLKSMGNPGSQYSSYKSDIDYNFTQTYTQNYGSNQWQPQPQTTTNYKSSDYSYTNQDNDQYTGGYNNDPQYSSYHESENQSYHTNNNNDENRPYSDLVRQYLAVVGQVFLKYADKVTYTVTQNQVPDLLTDTYAVLGREGYEPSYQDVKAWMKLCDVNKDGKVQFQDYQYFVVKSLERSGLDLYD